MDLELRGKRALVTGSTTGIGEGIAKVLAREGASVVINGRDRERADRVSSEIAAYGKVAVALGDLSLDEGASAVADAALAAFGGVDILVNNVGVFGYEPGWSVIPIERWSDTYNKNVLSMVRLINRLAPLMKQRRWGRLIQIGSQAGALGYPFCADYSASKAAVLNLSLAVSKEFGPYGITSNTVTCGMVKSDWIKNAIAAMAEQKHCSLEEAERAFVNQLSPPLIGRCATIEEVGNLVAFIASPLADYITGANVRIDSGSIPTINP